MSVLSAQGFVSLTEYVFSNNHLLRHVSVYVNMFQNTWREQQPWRNGLYALVMILLGDLQGFMPLTCVLLKD